MKKLILGIAALMFMAMHSSAMAAMKVPTSLCFNRGGGDRLQLLVKNKGTLRSSGGVIKQYGLFGHADTGFPFPVVGNAYVVPATTVLHGTVNGAYDVSGIHRNALFELYIDLALGTGTSTIWLQRSDGSQVVSSLPITLFNCSSAPVAGFIAGGAQQLYSDQ